MVEFLISRETLKLGKKKIEKFGNFLLVAEIPSWSFINGTLFFNLPSDSHQSPQIPRCDS